MERASHTALAEEGDHWAAPEWVLDVRAATEAQVSAPGWFVCGGSPGMPWRLDDSGRVARAVG